MKELFAQATSSKKLALKKMRYGKIIIYVFTHPCLIVSKMKIIHCI